MPILNMNMQEPNPCENNCIPFVPSPENEIEELMDIAGVGPGDVVMDMAAGDGRALIIAVEKYGARRAIGYEIDQGRYNIIRQSIMDRGLQDRVTVRNETFLNAEANGDLQRATVIFLYTLPDVNRMLKAALEKYPLRIISRHYIFEGWEPTVKANNNYYYDRSGRSTMGTTNMMQQIMEEMQQNRAAEDITGMLEKNGYDVVTAGCGCGTDIARTQPAPNRQRRVRISRAQAQGQGQGQGQATPPELPEDRGAGRRNMMNDILANLRSQRR